MEPLRSGEEDRRGYLSDDEFWMTGVETTPVHSVEATRIQSGEGRDPVHRYGTRHTPDARSMQAGSVRLA